VVTLDELNPKARRFAAALLRDFPKFRENLQLLPGGHFSASVSAPARSKARGLRCISVDGGDVWIQLGLRNAFYPVGSVPEMRRVLRILLSDTVGFAFVSRNRTWVETTLVHLEPRVAPPKLRVGDTARIISWSGTRDHLFRRSAARSESSKRAFETGFHAHAKGRPGREVRRKRQGH
jgi:hypothetical protein